jgi:hypothetical protein
LDSSAASRRAGGVGDVAWSAVGAGGAAGAPALARASSGGGFAEAPFFRFAELGRAAPARRFALAGGRRRCARYVTAAAAQKTTTIPPNTFSSGSENVRPMARFSTQRRALLLFQQHQAPWRAADAAEVLEGDQASARSVECSWRAAARTSRAAPGPGCSG